MKGFFNMSEQVLKDMNPAGYMMPWKEKKTENVYLGELFEILSLKKAEKVKGCADVLRFKVDPETGEIKLAQVWFCKNRLCPICNWRRRRVNSFQTGKTLAAAIKQYPKARFIFVTLTCRNVEYRDLRRTIQDESKAFGKMINRKRFDGVVLGYLRSTEITVKEHDPNFNGNHSYHVHVHALIMVKPSYFKGGKYLSTRDWVQYWRKAMQLDYDPICNVKRVRPNKKKGRDSLKASAKEVAKYQMKDSDVLKHNRERDKVVVYELNKALVSTHQFSYGGVLKRIHHDLFTDQDVDDLLEKMAADLDADSAKDPAEEEARIITYYWDNHRQNYFKQ